MKPVSGCTLAAAALAALLAGTLITTPPLGADQRLAAPGHAAGNPGADLARGLIERRPVARVSPPEPATSAVMNAPLRPAIAIIIDDLGYRAASDLEVLALPGPVACSILPASPHGVLLARRAHAAGKEVMLHQPMPTLDHRPLGKGALRTTMQATEIAATLQHNIEALPYVSGVNNHMGSLLTSREQPMRWVMAALRGRGDLFFVDSRTVAGSVAERVARQFGIAQTRRDLFLDNETDGPYLQRQLERLVALANDNGTALAIGHPHPETLQALGTFLPTLPGRGIDLVPVSELIQRRASLMLAARDADRDTATSDARLR